MGIFPLWCRVREGEMRYWFESLWEENNRSLTEATLKHKHLPCSPSVPQRHHRGRETSFKNSFAFYCSISLHLQLIVVSLEGRNDEEGGGGGQTLALPSSLQTDKLHRSGPQTHWTRPTLSGCEPIAHKAWNCDTRKVVGSNPIFGRLKACWTFKTQTLSAILHPHT